jgi:phthiodiolone/phenolphthiodiolone dimycocerosates ketoreductase
MKTDGPIDFDGNFSKLDIAWIGGARKNKPSMWALGGGPKLIDIACAKADGFTTVVPFARPTPEGAAEEDSPDSREGGGGWSRPRRVRVRGLTLISI